MTITVAGKKVCGGIVEYIMSKGTDEQRKSCESIISNYKSYSFEVEVPELEGTEKQVAWANDIRTKKINDIAYRYFEKFVKGVDEFKPKSTAKCDEGFTQVGVSNMSELVEKALQLKGAKVLGFDFLAATKAAEIIEHR